MALFLTLEHSLLRYLKNKHLKNENAIPILVHSSTYFSFKLTHLTNNMLIGQNMAQTKAQTIEFRIFLKIHLKNLSTYFALLRFLKCKYAWQFFFVLRKRRKINFP